MQKQTQVQISSKGWVIIGEKEDYHYGDYCNMLSFTEYNI